jgi:hypothetical protein
VQLLLADTFAVPQPPAPTVTVATETAEMQTQTLLLDHHAAAADAAPAPQSGGSAAAVAAATAWGEEAGTQTGAFANDVMMISIETQSDLEEGIFSSQHSAPSFHSAGTSPLRCNGDELEALDFWQLHWSVWLPVINPEIGRRKQKDYELCSSPFCRLDTGIAGFGRQIIQENTEL